MSIAAVGRVKWAGFLAIFVWGSIAGLLGAVLPALRERAGLSLADSGRVFIALSCGLVVASLVAGPLLDRFGKRPVLIGAVSLVVVALVSFTWAHSLAPMLALAFAMGAGGSALVTGAHALIADLNADHRAASLNLLDFFFGVGAFVTPFAIVPLQARGGVDAVLLVLAGLAALVFLYLVLQPFTAVQAAGAHGRPTGAGGGWRELLSPAFLVPALLIFLYVGTEQSIWDWQVTYSMQHLGMSQVDAARMLSVFPVAIMAGRAANTRLLLWLDPVSLLRLSTLGALLSFTVVMLAPTAWVATVALGAAGVCMAAVFPTTLGVLSARFASVSGTALGAAITCGWLGSVAISPGFGFVAHQQTFARAYLLILAAAAAMVVVTLMMRRTQAAAGTAPEANGVPGVRPGASR
jgi:fucose permease